MSKITDNSQKEPLQFSNPKRVYVAGPYSGAPEINTELAASYGLMIMKLGHFAHVPHMATGHSLWTDNLHYEDFMAIDLDIIEKWADCVFKFNPSPGANREHQHALFCNKPVFTEFKELEGYLNGE